MALIGQIEKVEEFSTWYSPSQLKHNHLGVASTVASSQARTRLVTSIYLKYTLTRFGHYHILSSVN